MLSPKYKERAGFQGDWISSTLQIQPRNIQQVDLLAPIHHITDVWGGCEGVCVHDSRPTVWTQTQNLVEERNQLGNRSELQRQGETDKIIKHPEHLNWWNQRYFCFFIHDHETLVSSDEDERWRRWFQRARAELWRPLLARPENTQR